MARILVVEDESGIAFGLEDTLRLEGYQVEVVNDGATASRRVLEETFDLVLLDVMLPGKDGFEVCRDMRGSGLETPIIFLTARTQETDRISGLDLGANDYVTKPFSPRELMARVRSLLRFAESARHEQKLLEGQIEDASEVQRRLFPSLKPAIAELDYAGDCRPALGVSGDYYDFLPLPSGRLGFLLADVCGKGLAAALLAASVHAAVRAYAPAAGLNCGEVLTKINRLLFETTSPDRFATAFYGVYDPTERILAWTNAGHCPPMWMRTSSGCTRLESLTPPAGILFDIPPVQRMIQLAPGDRLILFSDGIPEACDASGQEFGYSRLFEIVESSGQLGASRVCNAILDAVKDFNRGGPQADDLTVIAASVLTQS